MIVPNSNPHVCAPIINGVRPSISSSILASCGSCLPEEKQKTKASYLPWMGIVYLSVCGANTASNGYQTYCNRLKSFPSESFFFFFFGICLAQLSDIARLTPTCLFFSVCTECNPWSQYGILHIICEGSPILHQHPERCMRFQKAFGDNGWLWEMINVYNPS